MTEPVLHARWDDVDFELVTEMVARKHVGADEQAVQCFLKKGAIIPRHTHADAQWICVQQGRLALRVGDADYTVNEGDVLRVPGGVPHHGEALEDTLVLDLRRGDVQFQ